MLKHAYTHILNYCCYYSSAFPDTSQEFNFHLRLDHNVNFIPHNIEEFTKENAVRHDIIDVRTG